MKHCSFKLEKESEQIRAFSNKSAFIQMMMMMRCSVWAQSNIMIMTWTSVFSGFISFLRPDRPGLPGFCSEGSMKDDNAHLNKKKKMQHNTTSLIHCCSYCDNVLLQHTQCPSVKVSARINHNGRDDAEEKGRSLTLMC